MLPHALLLIFGKALIRFFEVGDCVSCLDFESVNLDSVIVLDSESKTKTLNLETKSTLDSILLRF